MRTKGQEARVLCLGRSTFTETYFAGKHTGGAQLGWSQIVFSRANSLKWKIFLKRKWSDALVCRPGICGEPKTADLSLAHLRAIWMCKNIQMHAIGNPQVCFFCLFPTKFKDNWLAQKIFQKCSGVGDFSPACQIQIYPFLNRFLGILWGLKYFFAFGVLFALC